MITRTSLMIAAALIALAACRSETATSKPQSPGTPPPGVPDNAIFVKDNLYMVPIKPDNSGCMMYRALSPGGVAVAAIFFRAADGGFVMDKSKSACN